MRFRPLVMLALAGSLTAQGFTSSAVTATPLVATASVPGQTVSQTVPAGTDPASINLFRAAGSGADRASVIVAGRVVRSRSYFEVSLSGVVNSAGAGQGSIAVHDVDLRLQAPVPTPVQLLLGWTPSFQGAVTAQGDIDVDGDGTVEFSGGAATQYLTVTRVVGPNPVVVRLRFGVSAQQGGGGVSLRCTVRPNFGFTVVRLQPACGGSTALSASIDFDQGVTFGPSDALPAATGLHVLVLGYQLSPSALPLGTCLLQPSLDYVTLFATSHRVDLLPVPQRPLSFLAQVVRFDVLANQMTTSDVLQVALP